MGFKCRLFGHTYGTPEVERSRTEDGDEVVITIRNVKRCTRCGDEQMVNQTKEVTSVRTPEEVGLDDAEEASATPEPPGETNAPEHGPSGGDSPVTPVDPGTPPAAEPDDPVDATVGVDADPAADATVDPAGGVGDGATPAPAEDGAGAQSEGGDHSGEDDGAVAEGTDDGWETGSDDWDDVEPEPGADDAVILDAEETERDEVQWPEESDADPEAADSADPQVTDDAPTNDAEIIDSEESQSDSAGGSTGGWPEHEDVDEGYSATPNGDVDAEFSGTGLTPEMNGGAPDDSSAVDGITVGGADGGAVEQTLADADAGASGADVDADADTDTEEGFVSAGDSTAEGVPADRVEFYCPNCGHARVAGASSIRAGDICPECQKGYIAERER